MQRYAMQRQRYHHVMLRALFHSGSAGGLVLHRRWHRNAQESGSDAVLGSRMKDTTLASEGAREGTLGSRDGSDGRELFLWLEERLKEERHALAHQHVP